MWFLHSKSRRGAWLTGAPFHLVRAGCTWGLLLAFAAAGDALGADEAADSAPKKEELPAAIDYSRHIRPILSNNCFKCHGPDEKERKGELRLDLRQDALKPAA